ncbi:uncharacterized protein [Venturia canescens]|uniref:uncharacterized protein n=1 Tax=Venturia canescens TaxID=32260 RepID=UPI001C9CBCE6|nr:uncharacterized protein LOC122416282 [Venturia canescens]
MSSVGESCHISDISDISRISLSSAIRPLGKMDSALNISECQASSSIREPLNRLTVSSAIEKTSKISRIVKLIDSCANSTSNYAKLTLLRDCLHKLSETDEADSQNIMSKLKNILATHEACKYLQLPKKDKQELTLLGITDLPETQITTLEKRDIQNRLEYLFFAKLNQFIDNYEKWGGNLSEISKSVDSAMKNSFLESNESDLMRWNDPTSEICTEYYRDLLTCADLLYQWRRLKYIETQELNMKNAENLLLQAQIAEAEAKISWKSCATRLFNETPKTIEAFTILSENLDSHIFKLRQDIQKKEMSKISYSDVASNEYDKLLKKYTEICKAIKKKEQLLEYL